MAQENEAPTYPCQAGTQPHLIIQPLYKDDETGATYVHKDLVKVQDAWDEEKHEESHIPPMAGNKAFGDAESFVAFVKRYYTPATLVTWNAGGLIAILDYAEDASKPGRSKWTATYPFVKSRQWLTWAKMMDQSLTQKHIVEALEELAEDVAEPDAATLTNILRHLRANVTSQAQAELRPDGSASISFAKESAVKTAASVELPAVFRISIPVLKGHSDGEGKPVHYRLDVRLRLTIEDNAQLKFRLSMPTADRALEMAYADRVKLAAELLGEEFELLRAAD